jgi:3-oxoacyl-[acyl-carrier protein] reductase
MAGLVPAIHVLPQERTWMPGTRPGTTLEGMEMAGSNELSGKVAIVTGAGRNNGRAIALALADGGASVLVNARSNRAEAEAVAREIETKGGKALVHIGDVADASAVQAMVDAAAKQFGRLDILVNNAALRREKPFAEMSYAEWREIMGVTLDGAFQ